MQFSRDFSSPTLFPLCFPLTTNNGSKIGFNLINVVIRTDNRCVLKVYHRVNKSNFLGFSSFNIRDLLRPKEPRVSLNLRTMDGVNEVGEVMVSRLQIEEETPPDHKCLALCDSLHTSIHDKENSPMMRVCKVYRFQTEDQRWLLVREQMSETPLSFSLPKQLLSLLIRSHTSRCVFEVMELGDLSPHLDRLRHDVICHCNHLIGCYQETFADLDNLSASSSFKGSCRGVWYEVITFGAPADHHQGFKHGGLKKLLSKHTHLRD
ncbi:Type II inositol 34-bisphosphate 4-phosphatase, partial [Dissostichus eleginoides]